MPCELSDRRPERKPDEPGWEGVFPASQGKEQVLRLSGMEEWGLGTKELGGQDGGRLVSWD